MNYKKFFDWYCMAGRINEPSEINLDDFAKAVVRAHENWVFEHREHLCAFCGVRLSDEEKANIMPWHYNRMCKSHIEYADVYQLDVLAQRENMPAPYKFPGFFD